MDPERELLKGNTPTLILAVLRDGARHGYGIAREIERRSGAALKCREGTLYPALHALEEQGLIAGAWRREGARERKVYSLTPDGAAALAERAQTWERFAAAIGRVIAGGAGEEGKSGRVEEWKRGGVRRRPRPEPAG